MTWSGRLRRPAGRAGAGGVHAALVRHTHATALLLAGMPVHVVSRRLGHADMQTTLNIYGHVTDDAEMRAVAEWKAFTAGWPAASAQAGQAGLRP